MLGNRRYEVGVGCLVVVAIGLLAFMALQVGAIGGLGEKVEVTAHVHDAAGLSQGGVVSVAGVQVGRVERIEVDFDHARATLSLDATAGIRRDARLHIRARSVLGEKYLELQPVSRDAPLLADGDELTGAGGQLEIDEMVSKVGPLLDAVDPKALSEALTILVDALRSDPEQVKRILADGERALHNVAVASDQLPALVTEARTTLATVQDTVEEARPILRTLEGTVERLDMLAASVPPEDLPKLVDEVTLAVKDGRAVLVKLDAVSGGLETLVEKANSVTREDILRITQEEGVLIRLKSRKVEDLLAKEAEE